MRQESQLTRIRRRQQHLVLPRESESDELGHLFAYSIDSDGYLKEKAHVNTLPGNVDAALYGREKKKFITVAD